MTGTDLERLGLGRLWVEGQPGVGEEGVGEFGSVLEAFEPVLDDRGQVIDALDSEVAEAAFEVRLDMFGGVEVGCVGR